MNKEIIINGKSYNLKKIDFTSICLLEELGFSVSEVKSKTFSSYRACFAFHAGLDLMKAGQEIEAHIKNKGKMSDLIPFLEAVLESDFFQNLSE
jgi:hypothetical protein